MKKTILLIAMTVFMAMGSIDQAQKIATINTMKELETFQMKNS